MSESGDSSKHSYSTGTSGGGSSVASDNSDAAALNALADRGDNDESLNDLMDSTRKLDEGVFAALVLLNKNRDLVDLRFVLLRILLEFLQIFRVVFNVYMAGWSIDASNVGYKAIKWVLIRALVFPKGYDMYIRVFYAISAVIIVSIVLAAWLAIVLKKDESSQGGWIGKLIGFLQLLSFVVYTLCWITIMDYIVFWTSNVVHAYFGNTCLAMPHLAHMSFALVMFIIFTAACVAMSVGDCNLNPLTRNVLATPSASVHAKVIASKIAVIVIAACADENPRLEAVAVALLLNYIWWTMLLSVGYYGELAQHIWMGLLSGVSTTSILLVVSTFMSTTNPGIKPLLTWCVLYTLFPAIALGAGLSVARSRYMRRPLATLREAHQDPAVYKDLKAVYRFKDTAQVEMLSRVMRKWDEDGVPDPDAIAFGEFILKCGMARFPNNPTLLVSVANMHIVARNDGQAARTQLQLAVKANPSLVERYFIFSTQELTKKLKNEGGGLDLLGYVEFQRNYRACVRAHKMALSAQRSLWMVLLHDTIQFKSLQKSFASMNMAEARASGVYRKVLERYPNNGRLLKVYGRFLEYCKNDPWTANRYYMEAMKQGTGESLMALVSGGGKDGQEGIQQSLGSVDEREDGIIIINASGMIMACNKPVLTMFGYEKGELEQKNVSCLMPQPFSGRHNGYLSRYAQTGEARILNTTRDVVGLTKTHSVFAISLNVVKISGTGEDAIFMGVVRPTRAESDDAVRVWVAPGSGVILTADEQFVDQFGTPACELLGRGLASLGPDIQALDRLVADASVLSPEQFQNNSLHLRTQLLHRFLPPVDVDITVGFGGTDAERILIMTIKCVVSAGSLMVVNHRGRIVYATNALGAMLGIPAKQLTSLDLQAIVPPPYAQLHTGFLKNLSVTPPATSCRGGAVVYLLRANGTRVPVTLRMSAHDDGEHVQHVVRVVPSSEAERLDRQRLVLGVGETGIVLSVNPGATKGIFGFNPQGLVGKSLSSFITVFRDYTRSCGGKDDAGLLMALAMRALEGSTDDTWRVGVTQPRDPSAGEADKVAASSVMSLALQQRNRERPALMSIAVKADDAAAATSEADGDAPAPEGERVAIEVTLWRSDAVAAVVEVDGHLEVTRADQAAGLLFGINHRAMVKKDFCSLAGLPAGIRPSDLFTAPSSKDNKEKGQHGKKSGLKGGGAPKTGARRTLRTRHADGAELKLEMQAVTKPGSSDHLVLRLQLQDPTCGSLDALLALQRGGTAAGPAGGASQGAGDKPADAADGSGGVTADVLRGAKAGERKGLARGARGSAALEDKEEGSDGDEAPATHKQSPRGVEDWVRQASRLHDGDGRGGYEGVSGHRSHAVHSRLAPSGAGTKSVKGGKGGRGARWEAGSDKEGSEGGSSESGHGRKGRGAPKAASDSEGASELSASDAGGGGPGGALVLGGTQSGMYEGSQAGGSSQPSGSDGGDAASSVVGDGAEDAELVADFRRAKRLKRLSRMFTSSTAQSATMALRQRTWLLTGVILLAHIVGFSILVTQIQSRYSNAHGTAMMARATDRFQLSAMRANLLQACGLPDFDTFDVCSPAAYDFNLARLLLNNVNLKNWHKELYLGPPGALHPFYDQRLYDYWTFFGQNETVWMDLGDNNQFRLFRNETLWTIGNKFITASDDVHFLAPTLKAGLNMTAQWYYLTNNGRKAMFNGYSWSLDTFVDYAWASLGKLKVVLIVLLVVETLCVQMTCMALLTLLVKAANGQHMLRFSVFLALPSATMRIMASRQLMVDDDCTAAEDDEELEGLDLGPTATDAAAGGATRQDGGEKKNVRMAADVGPGKDDDEEAAASRTKSSAKKASLTRTAAAAAAKKDKPRTFAAQVSEFLFGWLDTKVKVNGKRLIPNSTVILKFMAPLLLWAAAVVIVFGVSFTQLSNLQGPLSSLNAAAHVTYRISRVRLLGNVLAFSETAYDNARFRAQVLTDIDTLKSEYTALLYGGRIEPVNPKVTFEAIAPPSTFSSSVFADLFFKTKSCLRTQQDTCFQPGDQWYDITHSGLDAMITRWIDTYQAFANLPDNLCLANHTLYAFLDQVGGHDMIEGLYRAVDLFEAYTIQRFESVKTLHIILLVVSLVIILGFVVVLFRPYLRLLHDESKDIAGLLSQLPSEVAIEDIAKNIVIGLPPPKVDPGAPFGPAGAKSMAYGMPPGMGPGYASMAYGGGYMPGGPQFPPGADGAVTLRMSGQPGPRASWGAPPTYGGGAAGYQ